MEIDDSLEITENSSIKAGAKTDLKNVLNDMNGKFKTEEDKEKMRHIVREVTTKLNNEWKSKETEKKEKYEQIIEKQA